MSQILYTNATLATMAGKSAYGLLNEAWLLVTDGVIEAVGQGTPPNALVREDLGGRLVTPGLIDCHTHIVFGGNRAREFEMRLQGASYEEVARAGGGIVSTMTATRAADLDALIASALPRLDQMIAEGATTVEIKSGYGLTIEDECRMLRAARALEKIRDIRIKTSWLAAHALPPEYKNRADEFIDEVVIKGLSKAHSEGLVDSVDGFCEGIAFSPAQIEHVFKAARELGLPVKLHAEQLSNLGGAALAARYHALSADHLEYLDTAGIAAMAASGSVAVLLPGAFYTLRETQMPPVQALREAGVPIAIATDGNPGSSPLFSPLLTMNMACTLFRLTPEEALKGLTKNAAKALGLGADLGTLEPGKTADLAIWDVAHPAELAYRIGFNPLHARITGKRP